MYRNPLLVLAAVDIVILASDQGEHIVFRMRQGFQRVRLDLQDIPHLVDVALPPGVDDDLVAVPQGVQIDKGAGVVICIPDVGGDSCVAHPDGIGRALQVTHLITQPGHIPATLGQRHAHDGHFHIKSGDLQP